MHPPSIWCISSILNPLWLQTHVSKEQIRGGESSPSVLQMGIELLSATGVAATIYITIYYVLFMVGVKVLVMDASSFQGHMTTPTWFWEAATFNAARLEEWGMTPGGLGWGLALSLWKKKYGQDIQAGTRELSPRGGCWQRVYIMTS